MASQPLVRTFQAKTLRTSGSILKGNSTQQHVPHHACRAAPISIKASTYSPGSDSSLTKRASVSASNVYRQTRLVPPDTMQLRVKPAALMRTWSWGDRSPQPKNAATACFTADQVEAALGARQGSMLEAAHSRKGSGVAAKDCFCTASGFAMLVEYRHSAGVHATADHNMSCLNAPLMIWLFRFMLSMQTPSCSLRRLPYLASW